MKFTTTKIKWTKAMKDFSQDLITKKLDTLSNDASKASVKLTKLNNEQVKVTISLDGFRAQDVDNDFYTALHNATSKLKSIIKKHKEKYVQGKKYKQLSLFDTEEESVESKLISKEKIFDLVPETVENAIEELEQTDYMFYVFKDIDENNQICIIYRRYGEDSFGIIRCR